MVKNTDPITNERHLDTVRFFDYDLHLGSRTIFLGEAEPDSGVDSTMANYFIKTMHVMEYDGDGEITILMNNPGGDWYNGVGIYDCIKKSPCYIKCIVYGHAMSMGSIILQAADERIMSPHSVMLLHDGQEAFHGTAKDFQSYAKHADDQLERMYQIYMEKTGWSREEVAEICKIDHYYSASEAVEHGLADSVLGA